jgi:hypothetical protein
MRLIQEFGYTVKVGKDEAHQKWLTDNDAALKAAMPAGSTYMGTFGVVLSSEKHGGFYKTLIGLGSYAAMDTGAAAMKDPNNAYSKLLRDVSQFYDLDLAAPWSNTLMKDVLDLSVWDPKN